MSLNPKSAERGLVTYHMAQRLPPPVQEMELDYLNIRQAYLGLIQKREQAEQAWEWAKEVDPGCESEESKRIRNRLHRINSKITAMKKRAQQLAMASWAETFLFVAEHLLPRDVMLLISDEANELHGRPMTELR